MSELTGSVALAQVRKLDSILDRMRRNKQRSLHAVRDIPGLEFRRLNDPEGDTAIAVFLRLPDAEITTKFATALAAEGVGAGAAYDKSVPDWHIFYHWDQLIDKSSPFESGFPYTYHEKLTGETLTYSKEQCPNCVAYLERSVTFDVPPQLTEEDCDEIGEAIRKVADAYLG
jgi:8-amino-3,8-dideoxy-alpha-D-manno-octulosonate transaminase